MLGASKPKILLVDDDPALRESIQLVLKNDFEIITFASGSEVLEALHTQRGIQFETDIDLALLDVMMPGIDGLELLKQIKSTLPNLPIIMVSASNTVKTAVNAMRLGAVDFVSKPFQIDELIERINAAISTEVLVEEDLSSEIEESYSKDLIEGDFGSLVGDHPLMQEIYTKVKQLAVRNTTVLISGESGTGKELIAKELHKNSTRNTGPFVAINCAAIPETLVESELFGHEKGSFTHAVERRLGHFELANGGTIFLDEIGELTPAIQVKLLRVLQEREFYRIGRSKPINVDVRIIAATNRSLERGVAEGSFRQDLFFRVNVVNIELPPLRKRKEDIESLTGFFIKKLSRHYGGKTPSVSPDFLSCLREYNWPGNVRELENVIESIMALSSSEKFNLDDIPQRIKRSNKPGLSDSEINESLSFEEAEKKFETQIITKALEKSNFVQTRAAELLGISRRILKYKMDKLGITSVEPD